MLHKCPYCRDYETHNVHEFMVHMREMCPAIFDNYAESEASNLEQQMETGGGFSFTPEESEHYMNKFVSTDLSHMISDQRLDKDGCPEDSYPHIADEWANYLEYPLTVTDACVMLALFKIARFKTTGSADHIYDGWKYLQEAYERYVEGEQ
jgi:hypothetical protein